MAFQNVHCPVEAPQKYIDKYKFIKDKLRRTYAGMVDILDEAVGNITQAFKTAGYVSLGQSFFLKLCPIIERFHMKSRQPY